MDVVPGSVPVVKDTSTPFDMISSPSPSGGAIYEVVNQLREAKKNVLEGVTDSPFYEISTSDLKSMSERLVGFERHVSASIKELFVNLSLSSEPIQPQESEALQYLRDNFAAFHTALDQFSEVCLRASDLFRKLNLEKIDFHSKWTSWMHGSDSPLSIVLEPLAATVNYLYPVPPAYEQTERGKLFDAIYNETRWGFDDLQRVLTALVESPPSGGKSVLETLRSLSGDELKNHIVERFFRVAELPNDLDSLDSGLKAMAVASRRVKEQFIIEVACEKFVRGFDSGRRSQAVSELVEAIDSARAGLGTVDGKIEEYCGSKSSYYTSCEARALGSWKKSFLSELAQVAS